jgi:alkane 1-monooxygenase
MFKLKYLAVYVIPAVVLVSLLQNNIYSFFAVIFVFGLLPLIELFTNGSTQNLSQIEEEVAKNDSFYDYLLYSLVPIQYAVLLTFLFTVTPTENSFIENLAMVSALGVSCGVLGINAAHELGHRHKKFEQNMAKLLLLTSLYMHFFIEHNRGHHKHVATEHDPASSRYGESVYAFYFRSIIGSWLSAWKLEKDKLSKKGLPFLSFKNEMLIFQVIQLIFVGSIAAFFGWYTAILFVLSAAMGILMLETVNYIEHYGLTRKRRENGSFERTLPIHSWNSNHPLGRLLLLELSRHSDHHFMASRKYQILRYFEESPQMPTGYPGMMLLSLFPPFWFKVMHNQINKYKQTLAGKSLA